MNRREGCGTAFSDTLGEKAREALGIVAIAFSLFLLASLLSYDPSDPSFFSSGKGHGQEVSNYTGRLGAELAGDLFEVFGLSALAFPPFLFLLGFRGIGGRRMKPLPLKLAGLSLLIPNFSLLSSILGEQGILASSVLERPGGFVGDELHRALFPIIGRLGLYLFTLMSFVLAFTLLSSRPLLSWPASLAEWWNNLWQRLQPKRKPRARANSRHAALHSEPQVTRIERRESSSESPTPSPRLESSPFDTYPQAATEAEGGPHPLPSGFRPPPLSLLDAPPSEETGSTEEEQRINAEILEQKLRDFGVEGRVTEIQPGPVITRYEIEPGSGIKINRIVTLADDLALALKALSVRVVAPIPGKAVVGVEIPNRSRAIVSLREVLSSKAFQASPSPLPLALGKDAAGEAYVADLLQMPHLLIAGATGSGKSVCLHALILSILYRSTPQEVRFLLIDPKRVELSAYNGLAHLSHPVIFDAKEAAKKLHQVVAHMEDRYKLFAEAGARNLVAYNRLLKSEDGRQPLPYLVVVIDELADLMHMAAAEVENAIARLAQMARAVGIHLILATQRPSVDVITGVIKANFPARISFQVSSKVDSRTILDQSGAEQLLGNGDMLFIPPVSSKPIRVHGCYVSEPEIRQVVEFLQAQGEAEAFVWSLLPEEDKVTPEVEEDDQLYRQAVEVVLQTRQASISLLQRRLRVGFNRAARLVERMEAEGIVSPLEGTRPRAVLLPRSDERRL